MKKGQNKKMLGNGCSHFLKYDKLIIYLYLNNDIDLKTI